MNERTGVASKILSKYQDLGREETFSMINSIFESLEDSSLGGEGVDALKVLIFCAVFFPDNKTVRAFKSGLDNLTSNGLDLLDNEYTSCLLGLENKKSDKYFSGFAQSIKAVICLSLKWEKEETIEALVFNPPYLLEEGSWAVSPLIEAATNVLMGTDLANDHQDKKRETRYVDAIKGFIGVMLAEKISSV